MFKKKEKRPNYLAEYMLESNALINKFRDGDINVNELLLGLVESQQKNMKGIVDSVKK